MRRTLIIVVFAISLFAHQAVAKEGFYIGAFYPWNSISKDIQGLDRGGGLGLRAGVGGEHVAMELSFFETEHDLGGGKKADLEGGALDIKLLLPVSALKGVVPFVSAGIGKYSLEYPTGTYRGNVHTVYQYTESDGTVHDSKMSFPNGYQFGLGADVYVVPEVSLSAAYQVKKMYFDYGTPLDRELRARVRSFEVGVNYHF